MPGTPFMTNQLGSSARVVVEAAWGADLTAAPGGWTWTDITADVRQSTGIRISIGRQDELSAASPASCTFQLKNQTGAYTPYSPTALNYPFLKMNTPIRVRVTLDGSNFFTRFQGYANGWPPGWDADGRAAYVTVTASGVLRRLQQSTKPLRSTLLRAYLNSTVQPLVYYPLEDGANATQVASGLVGGSPARFTTGVFDFAQVSTCPGAASLPQMGISPGFAVAAATIPTGSDTFFAIDFTATVANSTIPAAASCPVLTALVSGGTWTDINIVLNGNFGSLQFFGTRPNLSQDMFGEYDPGSLFDGQWHHYRVTATQSGGNVNFTVECDGVQVVTNTIAGTLAHLTTLQMFAQNSVSYSYGHVAVFGQTTSSFSSAAQGYSGETVTTRLTRLLSEEGGAGMPLNLTGTSTTTMGPQSVDTLINQARECETADLGLLFDGLSAGPSYVCRSSRYNQSAALTVDANSGQVPTSPPVTSEDDDQRRRNLVVAQRKNGSSRTYEDTTSPLGTGSNGIGVYDTQVTINLDTDTPLTDHAAWRVHLGTVEGLRYPTLYLDLAAAPELASAWLNTTPSERIDLTNLSNRLTQHPPGTISLILEGYAETLNSRQWQVAANCSPYRPWEVFQIDDARLGRIETAGSSVNSFSSAGTSPISVASSGGVWSTAAPSFDVEIEGEQITVTAITGSSSPQSFTVTRAVNGVAKDHNTGAAVQMWKPGVLAL